jgi:tetratricopeptide (TPR) repeat protein
LEEWQGSLDSEQELYEQYYQNSSIPLELARSHNRFGILHRQLLQYGDSQRHFELSLQYYQQLHPDTFHVDVGEAWNALAALAAEQTELGIAMKHLHLAEPHFRYAGNHMFEEINEDTQEPHPELRKVLENQGEILRMMNEHKEALALYTEIEDRLVLGGQPVDRDLLLHKADCLLTMGDPTASKKLYELVLQRHHVDPDSLIAAAIHHQLGLVYSYEQKLNKFYDAEEALNSFSIAYLLRKRLLGDTHVQVGKTANAMGAVQASGMENPGSALTNFREALVIARIHSEFPNDGDDPEVKQILQNIAMVQKSMEQSTFQT